VFFSLMIAGLASTLPTTLTSGLQQQGVPHGIAHHVATLPPVSSLFAAVLGENPVQHLLAPTGQLSSLPAASRQTLTGWAPSRRSCAVAAPSTQRNEDQTMTPKIDPQRTALLVMDYQPGIVGRLSEPEAILARAADAIAVARARGVQVGYVRVAFEEADLEAMPATSSMGARVASSGRAMHADSPTTAIHDAVAPEPGDIVVRKVRVGAFSTTDLDEQLRARGVDTLVLAGISTSGVVLSTVRDGADRDYRLIVLADACADFEADVHAFLTDRILPRQAEVITVAELEERL
jgi:nicotinamidase-related amidase